MMLTPYVRLSLILFIWISSADSLLGSENFTDNQNRRVAPSFKPLNSDDVSDNLLFTGIMQRNVNIVDMALRSGADANTPILGCHPFALACCNDCPADVLVSLLSAGVFPFKPTHEGITPWELVLLHVPNSDNQCEVVRHIAQMNPFGLNQSFKCFFVGARFHLPHLSCLDDKFTAMHVAALKGNQNLIRLLYGLGANIDRPSQNYRVTPLMLALAERQVDAVDQLLSLRSRSENMQDVWGRNPSAYATNNGLHDVARLMDLRASGNVDEAIVRAIKIGMPQTLQALLRQNLNNRLLGPDGCHILYYAAFLGADNNEKRLSVYRVLTSAGITKEGMNNQDAERLAHWESTMLGQNA